MEPLSFQIIQNLSPDQPSLTAAKKLVNVKKWPMLGSNSELNVIWGQCQGSGANPYLTIADIHQYGYKCSCPSRKFPCKHVLALMWLYVEDSHHFTEETVPNWVHEWLGRRRKTSSGSTINNEKNNLKNIHAMEDTVEAEISQIKNSEKQAMREKRLQRQKVATQENVYAGLMELECWLHDQLQMGIINIIKELKESCRHIAARMVDAKATQLASRLDELPTKVIELAPEQQADFLLQEFSRLILLSQAWQLDPNDLDAKRSVQSTESREILLQESGVIHQGCWQCIGEKIFTRRDGLISHASWLYQVEGNGPRFALLQDYYPASIGKRESSLKIGTLLTGELLFYPSRYLERAILSNYKIHTDIPNIIWQADSCSLARTYLTYLSTLPWAEQCPYLIGKSDIIIDAKGKYWLHNIEQILPLQNKNLSSLIIGSEFTAAFLLWDGFNAQLSSVNTTEWGILEC